MRKRTRPEVPVTSPVPGRGRALAEIRRSGAAGLHGKYRKDRANVRRLVIKEEVRASE
jgi:hypothetical protein